MAETVEELTINYSEDGRQVVEELDKEVLSRGAWATVMYKYRERDRRTGEFGGEKATIRRYKKVSGRYLPQSKFNISSADQARAVAETLTRWF